MRKLLAAFFCGLLAVPACSPEKEVDTEALRRQAYEAVQAESWEAAASSFQKLTEADPGDGDAWQMLGYSLHSAGRPDEALPIFIKASEFPPVAPTAAYNAACVYAVKGDKDKAIEWLQKAMDLGFFHPEAVEIDSDMDALRTDPRFQALLARMKEASLNPDPGRGPATP